MKKSHKILKKLGFFVGLIILGFVLYRFVLPTIDDLETPDIIALDFPSYDLARATFGEKNVKMLLEPGVDLHSYEPTVDTFKLIGKAKLFVYNGGESELWVEKLIGTEEVAPEASFKLMDNVDLVTEETVEGMIKSDDDAEYDEHIWTSPSNMIVLLRALADKGHELGLQVDDESVSKYSTDLLVVDGEIRSAVLASMRKVLVFGDRFPFRYFVDEFDLDYYAAYPGCAESTEVNSANIAFLVEKVRKEKVPAILKIELSSGEIADAIAVETGAKVLELHSAHNISKEDFEKGVTYVDLMRRNLGVLQEALY